MKASRRKRNPRRKQVVGKGTPGESKSSEKEPQAKASSRKRNLNYHRDQDQVAGKGPPIIETKAIASRRKRTPF